MSRGGSNRKVPVHCTKILVVYLAKKYRHFRRIWVLRGCLLSRRRFRWGLSPLSLTYGSLDNHESVLLPTIKQQVPVLFSSRSILLSSLRSIHCMLTPSLWTIGGPTTIFIGTCPCCSATAVSVFSDAHSFCGCEGFNSFADFWGVNFMVSVVIYLLYRQINCAVNNYVVARHTVA